MDFRAQIEQEIERMEAELGAFVENANRQIAAQQGGIAALKGVLARLDAVDASPDDGHEADAVRVRGELNVTEFVPDVAMDGNAHK